MPKLQLLTETVRTWDLRLLSPIQPRRELLPMALVDPTKRLQDPLRVVPHDPTQPQPDDPYKRQLGTAVSTWSKPGWSVR
jgi:hypothetical protein